MTFRHSLALAILCFSPLVANSTSQPIVPDSAAGRVLLSWLDAFNSGDLAQLETFTRTYAPDWTPSDFVESRKETQGLDIMSIRRAEPLFVEFVATSRSDRSNYVFILSLKDGTPPQLHHLRYSLIPPGSEVSGFSINSATQRSVIDGVIAKLKQFYVFPDTVQKMADAFRGNLRRGQYESITDGIDFSKELTADLLAISKDKHLSVDFTGPIRSGANEDPTSSSAALRATLLEFNCGFFKVELLPGNVGYVKFDMFAEPSYCSETASAAMAFVAHSAALVFDLRENGGGQPSMIAYISTYLFSEPTHLNDLWTRHTNETQEFWTLTDVPGTRMPTVPVYVLTSSSTFSGAEEFANNLKVLKRATVVGEVTGGGAHPVESHEIDNQFEIYVPYARAINPITKSNWEGRGVEPDVKVPASEALDKALEMARAEIASKATVPAEGAPL